jgi:hypothetical protein
LTKDKKNTEIGGKAFLGILLRLSATTDKVGQARWKIG